MYHPNDVLVDGKRMSNIFNAQDEDWHNQQIRPIRNLWTMTKVLEYEPLIDETLEKFMDKLAKKFVDGPNAGKVCPSDKWLAYCMTIIHRPLMTSYRCVQLNGHLLTLSWRSRVGCHGQCQLWTSLWLP